MPEGTSTYMNLKPKTPKPIHLRHILLSGIILTSPLWFATSQVLAVGISIFSINTTTTTGTSTSLTNVPGGATGTFPNGNSYNLNFAGTTQRINGFRTSLTSPYFVPTQSAPTFTIRRTGSDQRQNVWYQGSQSGNILNLDGPGPQTQQAALGGNNVRVGGDSIFTNGSGSVASTAERLDIVLQSSIFTNANSGFAVFERGAASSAHDGFKIAAITGISNGAPTAYGTLYEVTATEFGTRDLLGSSVTQYALNNSQNTALSPRNPAEIRANPQNIAGVYIRTNELAANNTQIYGYSLFASDVTAGCSSANLLNVSSACYPTGTSQSFDPVAVNMGVVIPFEFSPGLGILLLGAWGAVAQFKRQARSKLLEVGSLTNRDE